MCTRSRTYTGLPAGDQADRLPADGLVRFRPRCVGQPHPLRGSITNAGTYRRRRLTRAPASFQFSSSGESRAPTGDRLRAREHRRDDRRFGGAIPVLRGRRFGNQSEHRRRRRVLDGKNSAASRRSATCRDEAEQHGSPGRRVRLARSAAHGRRGRRIRRHDGLDPGRHALQHDAARVCFPSRRAPASTKHTSPSTLVSSASR